MIFNNKEVREMASEIVDKEINQQVLGKVDLDEDKYKKMKSLTKNLKLKSVK